MSPLADSRPPDQTPTSTARNGEPCESGETSWGLSNYGQAVNLEGDLLWSELSTNPHHMSEGLTRFHNHVHLESLFINSLFSRRFYLKRLASDKQLRHAIRA